MEKTQARNRATVLVGIGILFVLAFTPVSGLTHNELQNTLDTYTYGREYQVDVWDCSDMSINIAYFLQEELGYDTMVMYYDNHAWVLVYAGDGWIAVETTADCVNRLGIVVTASEYYYGYYGEWDEVRIT